MKGAVVLLLLFLLFTLINYVIDYLQTLGLRYHSLSGAVPSTLGGLAQLNGRGV